MGEDDRRAGVWYGRDRQWKAELTALRDVLRDTGLTETFKWRAPCYTFDGANVAMPSGYSDRCVLSFFKGVLLADPEGILEPPGENSRSARVATFHSVDEIEAAAPVLKAYVAEAIELVKSGAKVELKDDDLELPDELVRALDADPELKSAWEALTPGRRRGYVVIVSQAKQSATRTGRIEKNRARILDGEGIHDR